MKSLRITMLTGLILLSLVSTSFAAVTDKYFRADKQYYDFENGVHVVTGNIVINAGTGTITGEKAQVKLSTLEFWGTGGWILRQNDVTFKGDTAYVVFGQNMAQIEGNIEFARPGLQITADKVDYNWKSKVTTFKGNVKILQADGGARTADSVNYNVKTKEFVN